MTSDSVGINKGGKASLLISQQEFLFFADASHLFRFVRPFLLSSLHLCFSYLSSRFLFSPVHLCLFLFRLCFSFHYFTMLCFSNILSFSPSSLLSFLLHLSTIFLSLVLFYKMTTNMSVSISVLLLF